MEKAEEMTERNASERVCERGHLTQSDGMRRAGYDGVAVGVCRGFNPGEENGGYEHNATLRVDPRSVMNDFWPWPHVKCGHSHG